MEKTAHSRISKREFISRVAERSGCSVEIVSDVYEGILEELTAAASRGDTVVLTGFGRFYRQDHKGHKVRFGKQSVDDYSVLKFSASRSLNRRLDIDEDDEQLCLSLYTQNEDEIDSGASHIGNLEAVS